MPRSSQAIGRCRTPPTARRRPIASPPPATATARSARTSPSILDTRGFTAGEYAERAVKGWEELPGPPQEHAAAVRHRDRRRRGPQLAHRAEVHRRAAVRPPEATKYSFKIINRAGRAVAYTFSGKDNTIAPREIITHTACLPGTIVRDRGEAGGRARYEAPDGQVYTLNIAAPSRSLRGRRGRPQALNVVLPTVSSPAIASATGASLCFRGDCALPARAAHGTHADHRRHPRRRSGHRRNDERLPQAAQLAPVRPNPKLAEAARAYARSPRRRRGAVAHAARNDAGHARAEVRLHLLPDRREPRDGRLPRRFLLAATLPGAPCAAGKTRPATAAT